MNKVKKQYHLFETKWGYPNLESIVIARDTMEEIERWLTNYAPKDRLYVVREVYCT